MLDWRVIGDVEVGGIWSTGERSSSRFNQYRDMDNGFIGEINLSGEKKDKPYYFDLGVKNPARDDQMYEGAFGRWGMFQFDFEWDRTPHVISNTAQTIYQQNGDSFNLPPAPLRTSIASTFTTSPTSAASRAAIESTINGLLRPVDLSFNTDVARIGFKYTPVEALRFDLEYKNIRREGRRPISAQMAGSTSGPVDELAIPIENYTHEVKAGGEYVRENWGVQFNYTGSIFHNEFGGYSWDNPLVATNTAAASATDRVTAAPSNSAHAFNLTGSVALPLRSRLTGTFGYTLLRQDQDFEASSGNPAAVGRTFTDDQGRNSADAQANLVLGSIVLTSRPINSVSTTLRYRYFEYQNDMPLHTFTNSAFVSGGPTRTAGTLETKNERYTRQNASIDVGWRPVRMLALKGGYEFEHWSRADYADLGDTGATHPDFSNHEHIGKFAADVTPTNWFLGRLTYTYGHRQLVGYNVIPTTDLPNSVKYPYADRTRHRVDALFQFTPWETVAPSVTIGYARDHYPSNVFGLTSNDYFDIGFNVDWTPLPWLTVSADYSYELYKWDMTSRYLVGGVFPGIPANDWRSKSTDQFHNFGLNVTADLIPKRFSITAGYLVNFGITSFANQTPNLSAATSNPQAIGWEWDKVFSLTQTAKLVARYRLTEKLSVRGGFAYERLREENWAIDPMRPFMGNYDSDRPGGAPITQGVQSVWLGATQPNYEAYTFGAVVRYDF